MRKTSDEMSTQPEEMNALLERRAAEAERLEADRRERVLAEARACVERGEPVPRRYITAARACKQLGRLHETLEILRQGISRCAPSASLYQYYIERLEKCNRTEEALATARTAMTLFPDDLVFPLREALILPILDNSREEIDSYRRRFTDNLHRIVEEFPLETPEERQRALSAIGRSGNKYLPYQGYNDRELQAAYGSWVQQIMALNYPQWAGPDPMPPVRERSGWAT